MKGAGPSVHGQRPIARSTPHPPTGWEGRCSVASAREKECRHPGGPSTPSTALAPATYSPNPAGAPPKLEMWWRHQSLRSR